jgi:predicted nucleotidyltransferase component of viral defense system
MIPKADIVAWRQTAPWVSDAQVEQDLIISRALVCMFQDTSISEQLAFKGGTALHKLFNGLIELEKSLSVFHRQPSVMHSEI